jgi:diadenosine tetraphosphatase ApaH/serine/threonine PP2A family protein phosphatase
LTPRAGSRAQGLGLGRRANHARPARFLASFEDTVVLAVAGLGDVLVCHATPGSDEEIVTSLTPDADLRVILGDVEQGLIVCGHTHRQYDRTIDRRRIVNAGSVGMPYQAPGGAYWLMLGPDVQLRRTDYDRERAAAHLRAIDGYWYADKHAAALLAPPDYEQTFEQMASSARAT